MQKTDTYALLEREYPNNVSAIRFTKVFSLRHLPLTTCSSLTICKLCVLVDRFEDCLGLLDGRLKQLTTFIVSIASDNYCTSINYKKVSFDLNFFQVQKHSIDYVNNYFSLPLFLGSFTEFEILFFEVSLQD
jgi:hypothetical protein